MGTSYSPYDLMYVKPTLFGRLALTLGLTYQVLVRSWRSSKTMPIVHWHTIALPTVAHRMIITEELDKGVKRYTKRAKELEGHILEYKK